MNIFNIQSLIAQGKIVSVSDIDALNSYLQIGIYQPGNRKNAASDANAYPSFAIKVSDLLGMNDGCVGFKPGSVGPKVSFKKPTGSNAIDVIIPLKLEITRSNSGGGIYNIAAESGFSSGSSPQYTRWNTQYVDAANTSWAPLWDIQNRTYDNWTDGAQTPEGNNAPPQYVGMPAVMRYTDPSTLEERYWLVIFTEWGVGSYDEYGFAYDRYEIYPAVTFVKNDYDDAAIDKVSDLVHIGRKSNGGGIYNVIDEPFAQIGVSPRKTKWNSIYTDSRPGYSGFSDLSNLESRVYTDFILALDQNVSSNVLNTELIMHDMTTDLYYKVTFQSWTSGGNGGGFQYTRQVIPQSCPIKFADGSVMTTASSGGSSSIPTLQQVLDNNHDLVDGNNFQGTGAGVGNTGTEVLGIGPSAAYQNTGSEVTAIGINCAQENIGNVVNAIGGGAAFQNTGEGLNAIGVAAGYQNAADQVNCIGSSSGRENEGNFVNAIGNSAAYQNTADYVNAFGYTAALGNTGATVNAMGLNTAKNNSGNNVNAIGQSAAFGNSGSHVNALGTSAAEANTASYVAAIGQNAAALNTGSNVVAIGTNVGIGNTLSGVFMVANSELPSYADHAAAVAALGGGIPGNTYLYHNQTTNSIGAVRL